MAETQITRVKSLYGDVKGLLSQIPQVTDRGTVRDFIVDQFNDALSNLSSVTETDYTGYSIPKNQASLHFSEKYYIYDGTVVRTQIGRVVSRLEEEYNFGREHIDSTNIAIFNKNHNEVSIQIDYTINDIIEEVEGEDQRQKLRELRDELEKTDKDWDKIREVLVWCLNFSKEVFLKILPILLQSRL